MHTGVVVDTGAVTESATARRGPGRPRDEAIDDAILTATVDELIERGFVGLSMEAVAARAGVAKTTLYRRWPGSTELAMDAMRALRGRDVEPPPPLPARETLLFLMDRMRRTWADPRHAALMRRVSADANSHPELYRHCRDRLIAPEIALVDAALRQAVDEGLIRPDADLDWVRSLLNSPVMSATMTLKPKLTRAQIEFVLDTVLAGLAP
jgi:AcrR family transcriptional regulator